MTLKDSIKQSGKRLDPRTTGGWFAKARNIAASLAGIGGSLMIAPIDFTDKTTGWIKAITGILTAIAGLTNLNTSKNDSKRKNTKIR